MNSTIKTPETQEKARVPWYSYLVLVFTMLFLSGVMGDLEGPLRCLDFDNIMGSFGALGTGTAEGLKLASNFRGTGGSGVKDGFIFALTIGPGIALAFGIIEIYNVYGGAKAAEKLFGPIMKFLLGLPGGAVLALISNLTASDAAAGIARNLHDNGMITRKQNLVITAFMYPGAAILVNYYILSPMVAHVMGDIPLILPLVVIICMKFVAATIMRVFVSFKMKEEN